EIAALQAFEAVAHPDLVAKYQAFQDTLRPATDVVYYPCSGNDCSPSAAFPDSRVVYAEYGDQSAMQNVAALQAAGAEAHYADARTFDPGPTDVVILLNPTIKPDGPMASLKAGGYAVVNDYHGSATNLHRRTDDFALVGILHNRTEDGAAVLDT